jgi:hypothetical protein
MNGKTETIDIRFSGCAFFVFARWCLSPGIRVFALRFQPVTPTIEPQPADFL